MRPGSALRGAAAGPGGRHAAAARHIPFTILYEDAELLVLDKPAGLVVHPAPGNEDGTLVNACWRIAAIACRALAANAAPASCTGWTSDTSGVMVVAKTEQALATLSAAFAARDLERAYLALVWGLPAPIAGDIDQPVRPRPARPQAHGRGEPGRQARADALRTLRSFGTAVSLLECRLATGRTHQIRVHLSHGHGHPGGGRPGVPAPHPGREPHAGRAAARLLAGLPAPGAARPPLGFRHPAPARPCGFETPPPADFQAAAGRCWNTRFRDDKQRRYYVIFLHSVC